MSVTEVPQGQAASDKTTNNTTVNTLSDEIFGLKTSTMVEKMRLGLFRMLQAYGNLPRLEFGRRDGISLQVEELRRLVNSEQELLGVMREAKALGLSPSDVAAENLSAARARQYLMMEQPSHDEEGRLVSESALAFMPLRAAIYDAAIVEERGRYQNFVENMRSQIEWAIDQSGLKRGRPSLAHDTFNPARPEKLSDRELNQYKPGKYYFYEERLTQDKFSLLILRPLRDGEDVRASFERMRRIARHEIWNMALRLGRLNIEVTESEGVVQPSQKVGSVDFTVRHVLPGASQPEDIKAREHSRSMYASLRELFDVPEIEAVSAIGSPAMDPASLVPDRRKVIRVALPEKPIQLLQRGLASFFPRERE